MKTTRVGNPRQRSAAMARDLASIEAAIVLVARHEADRVILSGLRYGERLLTQATAEGLAAGVLVALDRGRSGTSAIVVTPGGG
jgi:hypothetical protein